MDTNSSEPKIETADNLPPRLLGLVAATCCGYQTLSGAGLLKMFNKATDAVSKMTIKMNESDIVSSTGPLSFPSPLRVMGKKP